MVVELLANKIRNTKEIKGIKINEIEIKIIQMADDTTLFLRDLPSLKLALNIINRFHLFAGLKLNKGKTEAMWLGKWRHSLEKPAGLKWVKEVHSLGIFFSYDTDYVAQKNFTDKEKKFKQILNLWAQRDLSLIGKITILKSLAFSLITYQCCSLIPPEAFIKSINNLAYEFLWDGKPNKVKRNTIIADYFDGGLKMLDIKQFTCAQKAMWVKRLCKGKMASWKAYPMQFLNKLLGLESFKCNLNTKVNTHNIPTFYWEILKNWTETAEIKQDDLTIPDIRRQCIWLNKHIIINRREIKWNSWIDKNIFLVHDIINAEGKFLTLIELELKYNLKCNFLQYNSLKDAIPKDWRGFLTSGLTVSRDEITSQDQPKIYINKQLVTLDMLTNKKVYWKLIERIKIQPVTKEKWEKELDLDEHDWHNIFINLQTIRDTKIRTFQYKVIFNLIPCNLYLYRIGRANSYLCNFCGEIDNLKHFFYTCNDTLNFWGSFQRWWNRMKNDDIKITNEIALVGDLNGDKNDTLNACVQIARWYIYTAKLNQDVPALYNFLCHLRYKIKIEKLIFLRNGKSALFEHLWGEIENYME